jgi:hypothetical protein
VFAYDYAPAQRGRNCRKIKFKQERHVSRKAHDRIVGFFYYRKRSIDLAQPSISRNTRTLTHIYVRDKQEGYLRPCWATGRELYCGMCRQGTIQPEVGEVCPICSSIVERILGNSSEGALQPATRTEGCCLCVEYPCTPGECFAADAKAAC